MIPSTRPKWETVRATMSSIWSFFEMSHSTPRTGTPSSSSSATVRSIRCAFHSATTIDAPFFPRWRAIPRPMPCPAPVIMTTLSLTPCSTATPAPPVISRFLAPREPEDPFGDDVALDLARATGDGPREGSQILLAPRPFAPARRARDIEEHARRAQRLMADEIGLALDLAAEQLQDRVLGRRLAPHKLREPAVAEQQDGLRVDGQPGHLVAVAVVVTKPGVFSAHLDQRVDRGLHRVGIVDPEHRALVGQ